MNRIRELRKQHNMTQKNLAERMYVDASAVSLWEKGATAPTTEKQIALAELFNVTIDYLLGVEQATGAPGPSRSGSRWIPVLGSVAAGTPITAVREILDYEEIDARTAAGGEYFALRVKGQSMEPEIREGDVVLVRVQEQVENGQIAVISVSGEEATVKRVKRSPEGVMLIPINHAYEPMFYSNREIESLPVKIVGKVIEMRRKF